jgi:hypothetical protein
MLKSKWYLLVEALLSNEYFIIVKNKSFFLRICCSSLEHLEYLQ